MSRTWKWVVGIAAALMVAGVLVVLIVIARFVGAGDSVAAEIARIKAAGEPVSAADLVGKAIPDSENAAVIYEKAFKLLDASHYEKADDVFSRFLDSKERSKDPSLWRQATTMMVGYAGVLALAGKAAAMPKCRFPVDWSKGLGYTPRYDYNCYLRFFARLSCARAVLQARAGDTGGALRSIALVVRMSNSLKDEPTFIAALNRGIMIAIATRALNGVARLGQVGEADARQCADTLAGVDFTGSFANGLKGERAICIITFDLIRSGAVIPGGFDEKEAQTLGRVYSGVVGRSMLRRDEEYYLSKTRKQIEAAALPYRLVEPILGSDTLSDIPRYALMSAAWLSGSPGEWRARDRAIAHLAGDQLFLGLLAYRDRFGSYPPSLADLKKLKWQLPEDPFSGKPFIYRRQGRGFVLYSIGEDLKDNGGIEPNGSKPGDIVWKLDK